MNVKSNNKEGFSIIEVVLVLAIAGLIFLMVFIALPALQRNQRDTQRRTDANTFISQVTNYSTNNNGKVPTSDTDVTRFKEQYLKWKADETGELNDPKTGKGYNIQRNAAEMPVSAEVGTIYYSHRRVCDGERMSAVDNNRAAAVVIKLEGSGNYCKSNM